MEGPAAADSADDEYMEIDAEKWSEHNNTYENGDTLGLDLGRKKYSRGCESGPDSRGQRKEELKKERVATQRPLQNTPNPNTAQPPIHPLPERYITIRRPPVNANRGPGMKQPPQLGFFRRTTVCLVLLCILLIGGLLGLSFTYDRLSETCTRENESFDKLLKENKDLKEEIDNLNNFARSIYYVSSTEEYNCSTSHDDLFILNYEVLELYMKRGSFHLGRKLLENGKCSVLLSWNCTSSPLEDINDVSTTVPPAQLTRDDSQSGNASTM